MQKSSDVMVSYPDPKAKEGLSFKEELDRFVCGWIRECARQANLPLYYFGAENAIDLYLHHEAYSPFHETPWYCSEEKKAADIAKMLTWEVRRHIFGGADLAAWQVTKPVS